MAQVTEVLAFCGHRLAKYQVPKTIELVDELPTTTVGKVDKKALRAPYWAGRERAIH